MDTRSGNAETGLEAVMEHLVGRQGQPRGAHLSDWKGCSQDPPLLTPHIRVGSGGEDILLEIPAYLRPSEGKQLLSVISAPTAALFGLVLIC